MRKSWDKSLSPSESIIPIVDLAKQVDLYLETNDISEWITTDRECAFCCT